MSTTIGSLKSSKSWWVTNSLKLVFTHPTGNGTRQSLDGEAKTHHSESLATSVTPCAQEREGRRVGQIASFSAANADPPSAANGIERYALKIVQIMVGDKLAEARFYPPYR